MKTRLAALILLLLLPLTVSAQDNDVSIFVGGAAFETTTIVAFLPEDLELELGFENGRTFALGFNHFWRDSFSTEIGVLGISADPTLSLRSGPLDATFDIGDISVSALTLTGQWHFRRDARVSPYLGAGIALLSGEIEAALEDELGQFTTTSADFEGAGGIVFNGGVNFRMNDRWVFAIDVKAIPYSPEIEGEPPVDIPEEEIVLTDEVDLNPVIVAFGIRYRF
ncbi:MAG: OmpW/AlkL family protein [Thermoanaerobaculia bacterium]